MKVSKCALCNPKKIDWEENGFYGYSCQTCKVKSSAFIVSSDHKSELNDVEKEIVRKLINKHYPGLKPKGLNDNRKSHFHWYDFLVKDKEK